MTRSENAHDSPRDSVGIAECLSALRGTRTVILGVGNTLKGDDGVGPLLCARLAGKVSAVVIDAGTVPENYLRPIIDAKCRNLLIVDALDFGGSPGQVRVLSPDEAGAFAFSTHSLSLHLFLDLLGREIEMQTLVLGIQPAHTQLARPVSPAVQETIARLADALVRVFPLPQR